MDFLKKNYEKVVLGLVLLGLAVGAAFLPIMIGGERADLERQSTEIINRPAKTLTNQDLTLPGTLIRRTEAAVRLDFSSPHKVFNPVPWKKKADGSPIKDTESNIGPKAVVGTKTTPLYTTLTLDSISMSDTNARYTIGVVREAAARSDQRVKKQTIAVLNEKKEIFTVREVKGQADNPAELILEMNDTGERVSLAKEKPFKRVDGYTADLKYEPEKKTWPGRRVGTPITFGGEDYIIVAISRNEVVLSAKSNQKKWTVPVNLGT